MKIEYRDFEIEANREEGSSAIYYTIMHKEEEFYIADNFSYTDDSVKKFTEDLKFIVDDYHENPDEY